MKLCCLLVAVAGCDGAFDLTTVTLPALPDAAPFDVFVPELNCPTGYTLELIPGGSRYRALAQFGTAAVQHAACAADSNGGTTHLAVIDSLAEAQAIHSALLASGNYAWFVGAVQLKGQATATMGWVWVTGEVIEPGAWNSGEPNDFDLTEDDQENIGHLLDDRPGMVDGFGTSSFRAICECDGRMIDAAAGAALANSS